MGDLKKGIWNERRSYRIKGFLIKWRKLINKKFFEENKKGKIKNLESVWFIWYLT
jgi:hypothetical protein